jgi:hypothetical protein
LASAAELFGVDSLILSAIVDRESLGGQALTPPDATGTGDSGHGRGLGQIDDRMHASFIAAKRPDGSYLWQNPVYNLMYAADVLAQAWSVFGSDPNCWPQAIASYNAGAGAAQKVSVTFTTDTSQAQKIAALDAITTGGNYCSDVLKRRDGFLSASNGS